MTITITRPQPVAPIQTQAPVYVPSLENGDHFTRAEFERQYAKTPKEFRAELIEGVVHVSSPARVRAHGEPHSTIIGLLFVYRMATPGVALGDNTTVRLDADNEVQPDAYLRIDTNVGGQSKIGPEDYLEGAPELIVEIAASSASYDMHAKLNVYRRAGVQEYIVWRTQDQELDWFRLREGKYEWLAADAEGIVRSEIFPGLHLAGYALLEGKLELVLAELQKGIGSAAHQEFRATLERKAE